VGGGSAGAAVAGILAERGEQVLLLEAGPDYGAYADGGWPADLCDAGSLARSHDWGYHSEETYPDRRIPFERARVLGGCSAHNGCAAIWGHRADYDSWAAAGNPGWATDDLLPVFRAVSERLRVRIPNGAELTPFQAAWLKAAPAAGIPRVDDLNDLDEPVGMAPSPANIAGTVRWNTAFAYLDPVRDRGNLIITGDVPVDRVLIEGNRVGGVVAVGPEGPAVVRAERIVLAAGTYGSPAILLRSGVGDPDDVHKVGVEARHRLPGVGRNLHDHPSAAVTYSGTPELIDQMTAFAATNWSPVEQTIAKARSSSCREAFDLHLYPVGGPNPESEDGWYWAIHVACMTPRSRGSLTLRSADPADAPRIDHRYLADIDGADRRVLVDGVEMAREMAGQPGIRDLLGRETAPDGGVVSAGEIGRFVDRTGAHYYHPVGTCKMGPETDPEAVVDARGRVHGIDNLFVADSAIMPVVPRANTNVPAVVVGARIADWLAG
jgi:choline dehydrogenase